MLRLVKITPAGTEKVTVIHEEQIVVLLSALHGFITEESRFRKPNPNVEIAEGLLHLIDPEGKYK